MEVGFWELPSSSRRPPASLTESCFCHRFPPSLHPAIWLEAEWAVQAGRRKTRPQLTPTRTAFFLTSKGHLIVQHCKTWSPVLLGQTRPSPSPMALMGQRPQQDSMRAVLGTALGRPSVTVSLCPAVDFL